LHPPFLTSKLYLVRRLFECVAKDKEEMRKNWIKVKKFSLGVTHKNMSMEVQKVRKIKEGEMGMLVKQKGKAENDGSKEVSEDFGIRDV
jgi:hypothetical protein